MFTYRFMKYTPSKRKSLEDFFNSLDDTTRKMLSKYDYSKDELIDSFSNHSKKSCPIMLMKGKKVIAITKLAKNSELYICDVIVRNSYRRRNFGTIIINFVTTLAMLTEESYVYAEARVDNYIGQSFFRSLGFTEDSRDNRIIKYKKALRVNNEGDPL